MAEIRLATCVQGSEATVRVSRISGMVDSVASERADEYMHLFHAHHCSLCTREGLKGGACVIKRADVRPFRLFPPFP
jgi:hypothetical protein